MIATLLASLFWKAAMPVARLARRADQWLHLKGGRPYAMLLNIGLIADIVHRIAQAPEDLTKPKGFIGTGLAVVLELALLIHQLAEMAERLGRRGGNLVRFMRPARQISLETIGLSTGQARRSNGQTRP